MELNERQLFRALGDIDDSLLEAAEQLPRRKKPHRTGLWIAACLCLATLTLAVPYFALFTKGTSSADPNAKRIDKSLPQSTEAASDSTPNPGDPIQQFSPETSAEVPQAQVNSIPTQSYGAYPEDFSFSLTWEGNTYDSATGQFTPADGETNLAPHSGATPTSLESAVRPGVDRFRPWHAGHFPHSQRPDHFHAFQSRSGKSGPNHSGSAHPPGPP